MLYADLEVILRPGPDAVYLVDLRFRPPSGAADAHLLDTPLSVRLDHQALLSHFLDDVGYGVLLSRQFFADHRLRDAVARARATAIAANVPLRVSLRLPREAGALHQIVWERLCEPDRVEPLFLSQRVLLSRTIDSADLTPLVPRQEGVLSALAMVASPTDIAEYGLAPIPVADEIARIRAAVAGLPLNVIARAIDGRPATLVRLIDALRAGPDILYIICHGAIRDGVPYLWLEREDGSSDHVSGMELARRFARLAQRPLLVMFISCASAGEPHDDRGALAVGPHLAAAGVGAVIAMHGPLALSALAMLVPTFFSDLWRHGLVDQALATAREALLGHPEWSVPVLYLRLREGRLFAPHVLARPRCPYPGLAPFGAEDAPVFHGRDAEIADLLRRVEHQRQVLVIGPSGSGKSSLIAAGLLPSLARSTLFPADSWLVRQMRPGEQPTATLQALFGTDHEAPDQAVAELLQAHAPAQRLLLVIDQLEELFVLPSYAEREAFINLLQALLPYEACILVLVLRADFFPDLMASRLWDSYATHRVELVPLRDKALRAAIEQPAAAVEVRIDPALSERLLADAAGEPGALPLLQETMRQLWEGMEGRRLTLASYRALGGNERTGLGTAIATRADATLHALPTAQRTLARRVFLRLVQFGEGHSDTRRRQPVGTLRAAADPDGLLDATINALAVSRLLTLDDEPGRGRSVDIAHESLLSAWPTLRGWLRERRDAELTRRRLETKAAEWVRLGQGRAGLLDEVELAEADGWLQAPDATDLGTSAHLQALVQASQEMLTELERHRQEARQRELDQLRSQADERAAANQRLRRAFAGLAALLALALVAMGSAVYFGLNADQLRRVAVLNENEAAEARDDLIEAQLLRAARVDGFNDLDLALLLSVEAVERDPSRLSSRGALLAALNEVPYLKTQLQDNQPAGLRAVTAISPDGRWLATGDQGGQVLIWSLADPYAPPVARLAHDRPVTGLAFALVGSELRLVSTSNASNLKPAVIWHLNPQDGTQLDSVEINEPADEALRAGSQGRSLAVSPDGQLLALGLFNGTARLLNLTDGSDLGLVTTMLRGSNDQPRGLRALAFQPGSRVLMIGSEPNRDVADGQIELWDLVNPAVPARLGALPHTHRQNINALAFSPDGRLLASGGSDGEILLWRVPQSITSANLAEVALLGRLGFHSAAVTQLSFAGDSSRLVAASEDATITVWDQGNSPNLFHLVRTFRGHGTKVSGAVISPDKSLVLSGGGDGRRLLWEVDNPYAIGDGTSLSGTFFALATPQDGDREQTFILARRNGAGDPPIFRRWELSSPEATLIESTHPISDVTVAALSPDGSRFAAGTISGTISLWQLSSSAPPVFEQVNEVTGHTEDVRSLVFSPNGERLFSGGDDAALLMWEVGASGLITASQQLTNTLMPGDVRALAQSSDGSRLAIAHDRRLTLWDLNTGQIHCTIEELSGNIVAVALDHSNTLLALSVAERPDVLLWRQSEGTCTAGPALITQHEEPVLVMAFSPDSALLASGDRGGNLVLWDLTGAEALSKPLRIFNSSMRGLAFRDDLRLISAQACCETVSWQLNRERWQERACRIANRDLTPAERQLFLGEATSPATTTCAKVLGRVSGAPGQPTADP